MPRIQITDDGGSFAALPEGEYTLIIVKANDGFSEKTNNEYVRIQLQEPDSKKTIFYYAVFTKGSAFRVANFWRALGHKVKKGDWIEFEAQDIPIGTQVQAYLSTREYNGELQNDVKTFIEPDELIGAPKQPIAPAPTKKPVQPF
jgi:hypothetical protein